MKLIFKITLVLLLCANVNRSNAQNSHEYYVMGNQALNDADFLKAEKYFIKALQLDKGNTTIQSQLALTWFRMKRFQESDSMLNIVLTQTPDDARALWYSGLVRYNLHKDSLAIESFKGYVAKAEKTEGKVAGAYLYIARAYEHWFRTTGLLSYQVDDMLKYFKLYEDTLPGAPEITALKAFALKVKENRVVQSDSRWVWKD